MHIIWVTLSWKLKTHVIIDNFKKNLQLCKLYSFDFMSLSGKESFFFIIHRNIYPWLSWWHSKESSEKIFRVHFLAFTFQSTHEIYQTFSHLIWQNFLQLFCFSVCWQCWLLLFFLRNTYYKSQMCKTKQKFSENA